MEHDTARQWSGKLRQRTRDALKARPLLPGDTLRMKHINGGHGFMIRADQPDARYEILAKTSGETFRFTDLDAVIDAGWAVD